MNINILKKYPADLRSAYQLLLQNKNEAALKCLEKHLRSHPKNPLALKMAGDATARIGKWSIAENYYQNALKIDKKDRNVLYELSKVYKLTNRSDQAVRVLDELLDFYPDDTDALNEIGVNFVQQGMTGNAIACFSKAITLKPSFKEAYHNLSSTYFSTGKYEDAAAVCRLAMPLLDHIGQLSLRADLVFFLARAGLLDECQLEVDILLKSIDARLKSSHKSLVATIYNNCALLMMSKDDSEKAFEYSQLSITYNADFVDPYINIARIYFFREDLNLALEWFEKALKVDSQNFNLHEYLAILFRSAGMPAAALAHHKSVLARTPEAAQSLYSLSKTQFMLGDLANAYVNHEWRWACPEGGKKPITNTPEWRGIPKTGQTIYVYREQGIGDEVIFASCLPDLVRDFEKVYCACHPKLLKLFKRSFPSIQFLNSYDSLDFLTDEDFQIAFGNLPAVYRPTVESFAGKEPFILADEHDVVHLRQLLRPNGTKRLVVGFAWRSAMKAIDRLSIYPMLSHWGPLFKLSGITWVNLQYGDTQEELQAVMANHPCEIIDVADVDHYDDLDMSVALMKACDVVVGPATSTTMLSAAAGVPTLRLADAADNYMLGTNYYPWLPALVPLGRKFGGQWQEPIEQTAHILKSLQVQLLQ